MSLRFLRVVTLLALAGMTSGCSHFFCPLCLPVLEVDKDGLGLSPISATIVTWVALTSLILEMASQVLLRSGRRQTDFLAKPPDLLACSVRRPQAPNASF
jgi:hypothetical protein